MFAAAAVLFAVVAPAQYGPGAGPWEIAKPEDVGLSSFQLALAEGELNALVGERSCYLVVKDGKIVHETYRRGREIDTTTELYSHTKSMCSSVFGVAAQQGFVSPENVVSRELSSTRKCNPQALFQNVLTMTGQSRDLANPSFLYDASGRDCLNTLQDDISEQNPDGLWAPAWKDEHWAKPLGIEHTKWGRGNELPCGSGCRASCRDAARVGQLWANEGYWPGFGRDGRLMPEAYAKKAQSWVYPEAQDAWGEYGYTLWLWVTDDVDPGYASMNGAHGQCTSISREHNAVIVSFGYDDGEDIGWPCNAAWQFSKYAIVSNDHPKHNMSQEVSAIYRNKTTYAQTDRAKKHKALAKAELPGLREFVFTTAANFTKAELTSINKHLALEGLEPVPIPANAKAGY